MELVRPDSLILFSVFSGTSPPVVSASSGVASDSSLMALLSHTDCQCRSTTVPIFSDTTPRVPKGNAAWKQLCNDRYTPEFKRPASGWSVFTMHTNDLVILREQA